MSKAFGDWLLAVLEDTPDIAAGTPRMEQKRLAKLLHVSPEKVNTWITGRREPTTVEDVRKLAEVLGRTEAEILQQRGFNVAPRGLTEPEQNHLAAFDLIPEDRPDLQALATALIRTTAQQYLHESPIRQSPARRRPAV